MMKRFGLAVLLACVLSVGVSASGYYSFEQITVANTAIGLTTSQWAASGGHPQAVAVICRLEAGEIRYRYDGSAPTSSVGTLLEIGDVLPLTDPGQMARFSAIRTGSTSGILSCHYAG